MSEETKAALKYAKQNGIERCEYCRFNGGGCAGRIHSNPDGILIDLPCDGDDVEMWIDEDILLERAQEREEVQSDG